MNNTVENKEKIRSRIIHKEFFSFKDLIFILIDFISELEKSNISSNLYRFIIIDSFSAPLLPIQDFFIYQMQIEEINKLFKILNEK